MPLDNYLEKYYMQKQLQNDPLDCLLRTNLAHLSIYPVESFSNAHGYDRRFSLQHLPFRDNNESCQRDDTSRKDSASSEQLRGILCHTNTQKCIEFGKCEWIDRERRHQFVPLTKSRNYLPFVKSRKNSHTVHSSVQHHDNEHTNKNECGLLSFNGIHTASPILDGYRRFANPIEKRILRRMCESDLSYRLQVLVVLQYGRNLHLIHFNS